MSRTDIYLALCMLDAIEDGNLAGLQLLLNKHRANPNTIVLAKDVAPMHLVIGAENESFAVKATSLMLEHGGDANLPTVEQLLTPLHVAANLGRVTILQMLLKAGGNLELKDEEGRTPIQHAINEDHFEAVRVIQNHIYEMKIERKRQQLLLEHQRQLEQNVISMPVSRLHPTNALQLLEEASFTPNKIHYNFDATSPYFVNITHRRKDRAKKIFSEDINANLENMVPAEATALENGCESVSPCKEKQVNSQPVGFGENSNITNVFELTKSNLKNFARDSESTGRRTSFIESWREKIAEMKERTRVSRRLDDIAMILNSFSENPDGQSFIDENEETFVTAPDGENPTEKKDETVPSVKLEKTLEIIELEETLEGCDTDVQQDRSFEAAQGEHQSTFEPASDTVVIQISEEYIHTDDEAGVIFREKKMTNQSSIPTIQVISEEGELVGVQQLRHPPSVAGRTASLTSVSTVITLPPLDYDTDALRAELTTFGEAPGPITKSTKKLYLRKLVKFQRHPERWAKAAGVSDTNAITQLNYSVELMATVRKMEAFERIIEQQHLEQEMASEFQSSTTKAVRNFREGHLKKSFIYLLLDPRVSNNLPAQQNLLEPFELWKRFLSSVFYVGKGKSSRPYCHLYDAMKLYRQKECRSEKQCIENAGDLMVAAEKVVFQRSEQECITIGSKLHKLCEPEKSLNRKQMAADSKKLNRIIDIWCAGKGVVCLHIFHNIMPAEAYTREAAIIDAFGVLNLTNLKRGDYYSTCLSWPMKKRKQLGILLLYKAMLIHLAEGETQLLPNDL
uniref:LEM domain-containing protein n=1 Tax=Anopheles culicifacies TaxID=139723 RepID=A0A182M6B4_9DIPT